MYARSTTTVLHVHFLPLRRTAVTVVCLHHLTQTDPLSVAGGRPCPSYSSPPPSFLTYR